MQVILKYYIMLSSYIYCERKQDIQRGLQKKFQRCISPKFKASASLVNEKKARQKQIFHACNFLISVYQKFNFSTCNIGFAGAEN